MCFFQCFRPSSSRASISLMECVTVHPFPHQNHNKSQRKTLTSSTATAMSLGEAKDRARLSRLLYLFSSTLWLLRCLRHDDATWLRVTTCQQRTGLGPGASDTTEQVSASSLSFNDDSLSLLMPTLRFQTSHTRSSHWHKCEKKIEVGSDGSICHETWKWAFWISCG